MPGMLTHYLCGDKLLKSLENNTLSHVLHQYRQAFNLGTQGPDIFFFYRVWPWTSSHGINKTGELMHENRVNAFFSNALAYIPQSPRDEQPLLTAYLCGFACHHALDLTAHPYIFYRSGFQRKDESPSKKKACYHSRFETIVDFLMLQREKGVKPLEIKPYAFIRVPRDQAGVIAAMLSSVLLSTYGLSITTGQTLTAIQDMYDTHIVLRDYTGMKRTLLYLLGTYITPAGLAASMIYPKISDPKMDFLNLQHRPWSLPWDSSVQFTSSFIELFDQGEKEAEELVATITACLSGNMDLAHSLARIGNRSFSSGLSCETELIFQYHDSIFE